MRVTNSMYYENLYGEQNSKLNKKLFDVNKQIASGLQIQYASDDVAAFTETMRLDNEITTLGQIKKSTESGYKVSNQTDVILNDFETSMSRMRTLLLAAANETNDTTSRNAISSEMRGIESHLKNLANTSINGQYLFSGSAVDIKPIAEDGSYQGNDVAMNAFLGSNTKQQYNLTGASLFLGEEILSRREITSNTANRNIIAEHPTLQSPTDSTSSGLTSSNTIRDMMGDTDNIIDTTNNKHHFYLRGVQSNGTAFHKKISLKDDDSIEQLLNQIGIAYGNTPGLDVVNVNMTGSGQITVADKIGGSSKLDFHLVGAVDFDRTDNGGVDDADVTNLDNLGVGETSFDKIFLNTSTATNSKLFVKEFMKSSLSSSADVATSNILEGTLYDRTEFSKKGAKLSSNTAQILKETNAFATPSTKLSEVADLSQGTAGTLDATEFKFTGTNTSGTAYDVQINLKSSANGGSTFSLDGGATNYKIFDMNNPRSAVNADDMTYQQLMNVMNMVVTNTIPNSTSSSSDYDNAINTSQFEGNTHLSYDGKIEFGDLIATNTKATMSLHDANSGDFSTDSSVMAFNSNNALTVRDPKTDFFKSIDMMVRSVEDHKIFPNGSEGSVRNIGMENAIAMMDDLQDHVFRSHASVGAHSNTLTNSLQRTELLEISTMSLRSSVIDTDLAEASLTLTQLTLNYEAMLSTVGRVSKLSLVNYL